MALAWRMLPWVLAATVVPFVVLWGGPAWPSAGDLPGALLKALLQGLAFTAVYLASALVHEALHALAMVAVGGVPPGRIRFGLRWREGVAYVHAGAPMTARAYRVVLAVPGLVQGVAPIAAGLAVGSGWVTAYGAVMLLSAAGDVAVLGLLRGLPPDTLVRDHPDEVGCLVRF